jgi:hypothetical protein
MPKPWEAKSYWTIKEMTHPLWNPVHYRVRKSPPACMYTVTGEPTPHSDSNFARYLP